MKTFETTDFLRYNRQMNLEEVGIAGQLKIKDSKVLVIGAGGLGSPILLYLAACGVGTLGVVDFDHIEIHNLHRQILYTEKNINQLKGSVASARIHEVNPHIEFRNHHLKLTAENARDLIRSYDLIVDGCDNFTTRYIVNDICTELGKTLIYGSILGFEGQIAVFNCQGGKNLRDLFPVPPNPKDVPNCSLNGVLGTFPGIIGTIMAQEALKVILELPHLHNQLLIIDTLHWNIDKICF